MVTIEKRGKTLVVTKGAYTQFYRSLGYSIVGGEGAHNAPSFRNVENTHSSDEVDTYDEDSDGYDEEKPLSEMSFRELKAYADKLGIGTNGVSSKNELRRLIRNKER